jgi:DNA-binding SARP family transcriptional activator
VSRRPSESAHLQLLGQFRLTSVEGRDASPRSAKAKALIGYLALSPGGAADRARLSGLLWSKSADAKASLRQCLRELRLQLDEAGVAAISADAHRIVLNLEELAVDALQVRRRSRSAAPDDVEGIARLWAGELLADVDVGEPEFEQWLATEQVALRTDACRGLERALAPGDTSTSPGLTSAVACRTPARGAAVSLFHAVSSIISQNSRLRSRLSLTVCATVRHT